MYKIVFSEDAKKDLKELYMPDRLKSSRDMMGMCILEGLQKNIVWCIGFMKKS